MHLLLSGGWLWLQILIDKANQYLITSCTLRCPGRRGRQGGRPLLTPFLFLFFPPFLPFSGRYLHAVPVMSPSSLYFVNLLPFFFFFCLKVSTFLRTEICLVVVHHSGPGGVRFARPTPTHKHTHTKKGNNLATKGMFVLQKSLAFLRLWLF